MGTVFATVEDYKKRYGEPGDEERCKVLLSDATDQMLSAFEPELADKLEDYRNELKEKVAESNAQLV